MRASVFRFVSLLFCVIAASKAHACSLCLPFEGSTLLRDLDSAQTAVLAKLVRSPDPTQSKRETTGYRVSVVLKGSEFVSSGDTIDVPLAIQSPIGSVHLFLKQTDSVRWQNPRGLSHEGIQFVRGASELPGIDDRSPTRDRVVRLAFLLPFLVSTDPQLYRSAYAEFASAPNDAVEQLKPKLDHNQLRVWIKRIGPTASSRGLLFTLLRVCRHPDDLRFVELELHDSLIAGNTNGLDAIVAAYLTLSGTKGLDEVDRQFLKPSRVAPAMKRAVAAALRFHGEQENIISRRRIIESCRLLLSDAKTADHVIVDLGRWKDWESLDEILRLWGTVRDNRWLRQPILEYLKLCPLEDARSTLAGVGPESRR